MLLARTPMKPAGDVHDAPKPMKWLRCLQCNQKFPEDEFKAHQRESKSPCELVRSPRHPSSSTTPLIHPSTRSDLSSAELGSFVGARGRSAAGHVVSRGAHAPRLARTPRRGRPVRSLVRDKTSPRLPFAEATVSSPPRLRARASRTVLTARPRADTATRPAAPLLRHPPRRPATSVPTEQARRVASPGLLAVRVRSVVAGQMRRVPRAPPPRPEGRTREGLPRPRVRRRPLAAKRPAAAAAPGARAAQQSLGGGGEARTESPSSRGGPASRARPSPRRRIPTRDDRGSHRCRHTPRRSSRANGGVPGAPAPDVPAQGKARPRVEPAAQARRARGRTSLGSPGPSGANPGGFRQGPRPEGAPEEARRHGDAQAQSTQGVHR